MISRLRDLSRLAAVPAVREVLSTAAGSATVRELAAHARRDPRSFARRLAKPRATLVLLRKAGDEPSVRRLVGAGLLFMPLRYFAVAQAALWGARRVGRLGGRRGEAGNDVVQPARP